jgi:hypothetical protein
MIFHRPDSILQGNIDALKNEISSRDWRAIKAFRLGKNVDELYPGETGWYEEAVEKINRLEAQLPKDSVK